MSYAEKLVREWFRKWEEGDFLHLPLTEDFSHISPYGIITGKEKYIRLVDANKDKFLGHSFELHDQLYEGDRACVRYTARKGNFAMEVSEWYYFRDRRIGKIIAYYNIEGDIDEDHKLSKSEVFE